MPFVILGSAMNYSKLYNFAVASYAKLPYHFGGGRAFRPLSLFVELTYRCNFRCNMCQFLTMLDDPRLNEKKGDELTTDEINRVVDQISGLGLIVFTGGEPLLRKDIMELTRHAARRHKVYMVTNGILLKEEMADEFVRLGCRTLLSRGMASVGISLEALGPRHDEIVQVPGSFEKIMGHVRHFVAAKKRAGKTFPLVWLKCVITAHNVAMLDDMYALAEEAGVDMFNPITYYGIPATDRLAMQDRIATDTSPIPVENFDAAELRRQIEKMRQREKRSKVQLRITPPGLTDSDVLAVYEGRLDMGNKACYTPWSSAALSAYGDVFPCSNYAVGNIRHTPFMELWNNDKMVSFRRELKERKIFKSCAACCSMVYEGSPSRYPPVG